MPSPDEAAARRCATPLCGYPAEREGYCWACIDRRADALSDFYAARREQMEDRESDREEDPC